MTEIANLAPRDMTLDELRPLLVEAMLPHVPFDGWSDKTVDAAAADLGVAPAAARPAESNPATTPVQERPRAA